MYISFGLFQINTLHSIHNLSKIVVPLLMVNKIIYTFTKRKRKNTHPQFKKTQKKFGNFVHSFISGNVVHSVNQNVMSLESIC